MDELHQKLHEEACTQGKKHYMDPQTGNLVFTALEHLERGYCCESNCLHCPYGFTEKNENGS